MKFFYSSNRAISLLLFVFIVVSARNASAQRKIDSNDYPSADSSFIEATSFMFQGLMDKSISSFTNAVNGFEKSENVKQTIACYLGIATCYTIKGDFKKSLEFNEKALSLHKNKMVNDQEGLDLIMSNLALCKEAQRVNNGTIK
jgi:tetratricopeptide (TPR) repeat protein